MIEMTMKPNPALKKLGLSDSDRAVILHSDDVGMCQASVQAFIDLWESGGVSSGALMMPCPWAKTAAEYCRTHPGVDMGVHATLTAEWPTYRWRPLSTLDPATGLMDQDGFLWRTSEDSQAHADPDAAMVEMKMQVRTAIQWGVDVTHMDTHMGTVAHAKFITSYLQTGFQNHLALMIPRGDPALFQALGVEEASAREFAMVVGQLEEQGFPLLDNFSSMPLDQPEGQVEIAKKLLSALPPGITHFVFHPSVDTPELRHITPDWPSRVANYHTFLDRQVRDFIRNAGIHIIGYRDLKKLLPE